MAMTTAKRLEEVNTAISKVLDGGQSYQLGSRKLTRADLGMLREMRKELQEEVAAEDGGSLFRNTYVGYFDGR